MSAALIDGFNSASGESQSNSLLQFWDVNALFLEVGILLNHPGRVELGSPGSIGVATSNS